jgi:hypothetical protein
VNQPHLFNPRAVTWPPPGEPVGEASATTGGAQDGDRKMPASWMP